MHFSEQIDALLRLSHNLLYLGMDGSPIYSDELARMSGETFRLCNELYDGGLHGASPEEEASLCLALLLGYNATLCDHGDRQQRIQQVLEHSWKVLPHMSDPLLKVRLLTYCYSECYEEELADQAHAIIATWNADQLTSDQKEIIEELQNIEDNPYPWEYID